MIRFLRVLVAATLGLTFIVIVVGAYVRLSDAGLGCPDWPGCYGHPVPRDIADADALAKAWKEMGHRYLAGALGLLLLLVAVLAWRARRAPWLASAIVLLVAFQATLGMWTVTMLLKPAIVTAHLIGGMTILSLLLWYFLSLFPVADARSALRAVAAAALSVVAAQIVLGGWVSANYAALACPDLPGCRGVAVPQMDFANAFHVLRELGRTDDGDLLPLDALVAIHWSHRMFALVVVAVVIAAALKALREPSTKTVGIALLVLLAAQFSLGIANVALSLPLPLAAAHNAGAALLLAALVVLNFCAFKGLPSLR
ncbi:MAG TPA: COX15/CtaA family protein [Burkholderiales bacterium]|nr:COX15/CtaA family protein [Burkholderiales bacterium]